MHKVKSWWDRLLLKIDELAQRRRRPLSEIMTDEDADDDLEISQTERTITEQQYLRHMANGRKAARDEWRRLQQEKRKAAELAASMDTPEYAPGCVCLEVTGGQGNEASNRHLGAE